MVAAARILIIFLAACGLCPLTAISERIPRWLDVCTALFRTTLAVAYACLFMMTPSVVNDLQGKTFQASLISVRFFMVAYQIFVLPMFPAIGQCLPKLHHLRLGSPFALAPFFLYTTMIFSFGFLWRNPFQSWSHIALIFPNFSLAGSIAVATLQTVILINFKQQLQEINIELKNPPKSVLALENLLARSAKKRAKLNELMSDSESGLGPLVAATIFAICLRLSFMTFANFSAAMKVFSGSLTALRSVIATSVRTILKIIILLQLAHCGQQLVEEDSKSKAYLDRIVATHRNLPDVINYQIGKCRQVFNNGKTGTNAWGFFYVDHSLILMMVNIMFSLVSIQIQFYVSEAISAPN